MRVVIISRTCLIDVIILALNLKTRPTPVCYGAVKESAVDLGHRVRPIPVNIGYTDTDTDTNTGLGIGIG